MVFSARVEEVAITPEAVQPLRSIAIAALQLLQTPETERNSSTSVNRHPTVPKNAQGVHFDPHNGPGQHIYPHLPPSVWPPHIRYGTKRNSDAQNVLPPQNNSIWKKEYRPSATEPSAEKPRPSPEPLSPPSNVDRGSVTISKEFSEAQVQGNSKAPQVRTRRGVLEPPVVGKSKIRDHGAS